MPRRRAWSLELFVQAVADSISISGVLSRLGLTVSGWNYLRVHRLIEAHKLDTWHWLGMAHLRGKTHTWTRCIPLSDVLVERSTYGDRSRLKRRLLREGLLAPTCAECGLADWRGRPLSLQLDHINGVGDDHRIENLRLLCPNCHSQTSTYCGRNMRRRRN